MSRVGEPFSYDDLQRAALSFVVESETWGPFLAWMRHQARTKAARDWLDTNPQPQVYRRMWIEHVDDPELREIWLARYDTAFPQ